MTQTALATNAVFPLNHQQWSTIQALQADLRPEQLQWLSGYFAGAAATTVAAPVSAPQATEHLTILYGSQTGNSKKVAERAAQAAQASGLNVQLHSMADFRAAKLKKETWVLLVISTHGEGEPPDSALGFYEELHSKRLSQLSSLNFSVLALGDSSYKEFCKTGRDIESRLLELGAQPLLARVECDLAFEVPAERWVEEALGIVADALKQTPTDATAMALPQTTAEIYHDSPTRPFQAAVLERVLLNGRGSNKEVWHLELSLEDSGIAYEAGDALGIVAQNNPQLVAQILETLSLASDTKVEVQQQALSAEQALSAQLEITRITRPVLKQYAEATGHDGLIQLFDGADDTALEQFIDGRDWLDLLREFEPRNVAAPELLAMMRPLAPRLYSIASSPSAYPDEVHLTVAAARWQFAERARGGVVSTQIADRLAEADSLPVYLHRNDQFRLPQDGSAPVIMIGPGTGVAPFRAFVEERQQLGHSGNNWLFFGDRHFRTDFLYQTDWLRWRKEGLLSHIDVAFSRDQAEKVYVQHRILQRSKELFRWLEAGAHVYVCGDANHMAKDVESALLQVIQLEQRCTPDIAREYLQSLQQQQRYQRDVY
jgi:sulfite reductase (NADPH) flavoprotein alpha-component